MPIIAYSNSLRNKEGFAFGKISFPIILHIYFTALCNHDLLLQVMWPSLHLAEFLGTPKESGNESIDFGLTSPLHHKASILAKSLLGPDMEFDFDMLITKEGRTETETPWHCDEAYWLKEMPDKRALSFWFPMSDVDVVLFYYPLKSRCDKMNNIKNKKLVVMFTGQRLHVVRTGIS